VSGYAVFWFCSCLVIANIAGLSVSCAIYKRFYAGFCPQAKRAQANVAEVSTKHEVSWKLIPWCVCILHCKACACKPERALPRSSRDLRELTCFLKVDLEDGMADLEIAKKPEEDLTDPCKVQSSQQVSLIQVGSSDVSLPEQWFQTKTVKRSQMK